jgi:hypothetical protein
MRRIVALDLRQDDLEQTDGLHQDCIPKILSMSGWMRNDREEKQMAEDLRSSTKGPWWFGKL